MFSIDNEKKIHNFIAKDKIPYWFYKKEKIFKLKQTFKSRIFKFFINENVFSLESITFIKMNF